MGSFLEGFTGYQRDASANDSASGQGFSIGNAAAGFTGGLRPYDPGVSGPQQVSDNRVFSLSEGAIVVNASPGQSETEIGRQTAKAWRDEVENVTLSFDSDESR